MERQTLYGALCAAVALSGCSGGAAASHSSVPQRTERATVDFHIVAGKLNASGRRSSYVSPSTASVEIRVHSGSTLVSDLSQNVTSCIQMSGGCTIAMTIALGTYTWDVIAYDAASNQLSSNLGFPVTIANQTNTIGVALQGTVSGLSITAASGQDVTGSSATGFTFYGALTASGSASYGRALTVTAMDADGDVITGAGSPAVGLTSSSAAIAVTVVTTANPASFTLTPADPGSTSSVYSSGAVTLTASSGTASSVASASVLGRFAPRVYVDDLSASTVRAYDEAGNAISLSGSFSGLSAPVGLVYDPTTNDLYVSDYGNGKLAAYDLNGNAVSTIATMPSSGPEALAIIAGTPSMFYVPHQNGNVYVYDDAGASHGTFDNGYSWPAGAAYDPVSGTIVVVDFSSSQAYLANSSGGSTGSFNPGLSAPLRAAYDPTSGAFYLADASAISAFTATGAPVSTSGSFAGLNHVYGLGFNPSNGYLYVANNITTPLIRVFDNQGNSEQAVASGGFPGLAACSNCVASIAVVP